MKTTRLLSFAALAATGALVLAGCSTSDNGGGSTPDADAKIQIVASTNVYGQIAEAIGGDEVEVTSIVSSAAQDPHSFEPSATDKLSIEKADLIIENGGGYDSFIETLAEGTDIPVITAVEFSHDWPGDDHDQADDEATDDHDHDHSDEASDEATEDADHDHDHDHDHDGYQHIEGFNEHVWYDPHTIEHLAEDLADELTELRPDAAATFQKNLDEFLSGIADLESSLETISTAHAGEKVFATEPVPLYLVAAAGLENVSPADFTEAVEEGQDVPPAVLLESIQLIDSGDVRAVLVNSQTGGAETTRIEDEAKAKSIPVVAFSETLPDGDTYLTWMTANIESLASALD